MPTDEVPGSVGFLGLWHQESSGRKDVEVDTAFHAAGRGKKADGESGQGNIALLFLHARRADSDFVYSGDQPLAAETHRLAVSPD